MTSVEVLKGDITKLKVDAIVNAANSSLMGGGGVDGAIHRAGGPAILEECKEIVAKHGGCATGQAVITTGGNLPSQFIIHTVGPVWHGGTKGEERLLSSCYLTSLKIAQDHKCKSIAFPNISTGIYGYPKEEAARISITTVLDFVNKIDAFDKVVFVCFDDENYRLYQSLIERRP